MKVTPPKGAADPTATEVRPDEMPFEDTPPEIVQAMGARLPTVQQWEAISHPLTPCSVVAGAGSGKTAVMAARVTYLVLARKGLVEADHEGALPSEILCLTFTNKAAEELARRVRDATDHLGLPEGEEATVLTYHAFAAYLLDAYGLRIGLEPGPMLLSEAHKWQLVQSLFADRVFHHVEVRSIPHVVADVLQLADQCANHLVDPDDLVEASLQLAERREIKTSSDTDMRIAALRRSELAEVVSAYRDRKRELGLIDYGDQIALAHRLVSERPEIAEEFRERYRVVLLDEYQDTNWAQAQLLGQLCGRGHPVLAVGDPDQNIYAWRGATLANVLRFHHDFSPPGEEHRRPLYVNFRSGSRILAVADAVIGAVPPERRAEDKELRPHPERGEGRVLAFVAGDQYAEAKEIARLINERASEQGNGDGEFRYDQVAILCRKRKLMGPIADVLREEGGIPVEVVDLGGLLRLPEAVDVLAWLRILENPADNVALARILLGPRWRIGYRDLVALARWSAERNYELADTLEQDRSPGDVRFALLEALDHLDDIDGLSEEARARLNEFRGVLEEMRGAARGALGDVLAQVIERSGILRELEASADPAAVGARRNLLNLVEHVSAFSPVEGEASLSTLVEYLDAAGATEDELEPVQPSDENTVKMMTIHKAKGLEWDVVFVPGLAESERRPNASLFPDTSRQPNPVEQPKTLPFELRGDADDLPQYEGNIKEFKERLKERGLEEERRLCYVALTRARDLLVCSAAHWYEGPATALQPGSFYKEIAAHDACEVLFEVDRPEVSPLLEERRSHASWPPQGRDGDTDELFPEGWHAAAAEAVGDPSMVERFSEKLAPADLGAFRDELAGHQERANLIAERTADPGPERLPQSLSVSSVIDFARCPKLFYWSVVRPLPRRPSPAARLGSDVHRWIEQQSSGQVALIDVEELPDLSTEERLGEPGDAAKLREEFRSSRFAKDTPLFTERPFLLYLDGVVVGGRIDAIFGTPEGPWEVVDYKTGRAPSEDDPLRDLQIDLYALACVDVWGKRPEDLTVVYYYLREGKELSRPAGDPEETRARVAEAFSRMSRGEFDPSPGPQCHWCDFRVVCAAGQEYVRAEAEAAATRSDA
ncbi:MAG: ATP-dependent helicase [Actinomycetota bacterium]